jgi:hypothetical protein
MPVAAGDLSGSRRGSGSPTPDFETIDICDDLPAESAGSRPSASLETVGNVSPPHSPRRDDVRLESEHVVPLRVQRSPESELR